MFKANPSEEATEKITKHKKSKGKKGSMFAMLKKPAPKTGKKMNIFEKMGTAELNS